MVFEIKKEKKTIEIEVPSFSLCRIRIAKENTVISI